MNVPFPKYVLVLMAIFIVVSIILSIRYEKWYENLKDLCGIAKFEIYVHKSSENRHRIVLNDSIKFSSLYYEFLSTNRKLEANKFYWLDLEKPFFIRRAEGSDTLWIFSKDSTEFTKLLMRCNTE